ncbi:MAG: ABC transporter permease [Candidatus Asgardarchaeia archaeon]
MSLLNLEKKLSTRFWQHTAEVLILSFFFIFIVSPILYLFSMIFVSWDEVYTWVFSDPILGSIRWSIIINALLRSFEIALIVTVLDIVIGLPMAVILARKEFKGKAILDTLVDLPMAVPTSALGFSMLLFWGSNAGISSVLGLETGLFSPGPILIMVTHVAFTYPYIVRSMKTVIEEIDVRLEYAARSLSAPTFSVFRTITLPLALEGLLAGSILSFTRSLGETGATLIVCGIYETAPIVVVTWRKLLIIPPAAFLSAILVITAIFFLLAARFLTRKVGISFRKIWVGPERILSSPISRFFRDASSISVFLIGILLPSLFTVVYTFIWWSGSPFTGRPEDGVFYQVFLAPDRKFEQLVYSLLTSFEVASITTVANIIMGVPMAFLIVRRNWGKVNQILDLMIDVPLIIPTSALGFSIFLFWSRGLNLINPGFWLIVVVHIVFTYPYMVRPLIAVVQGIDREVEEAAKTLGASPLTVFRTITLPMIKNGIISSSIMTFTRSLSETGATVVVMGLTRTIPVLIVDWTESLALRAASFASVLIIAVSFMMLAIIRKISR